MRLKLDIQKFAGNTYIFSNGDMSVMLFWASSVVGNTPAQKAQNNKSNVGADIYVRSTNAWSPTWGTFTGSININGVNYGFSKYGEAPNDGTWLYLGSASTIISHNPDGKKTIYVGGTVTGPTQTSWEGRTASYGTNVSLDVIQRMSSINSFVGLDDGSGRTNNVEGNFKVELTRYNQTFSDNLVIEYLDVNNTGNWITLKTINNYESEDTFSFTNAELQTLFSVDTLSNDIKLRAYLKTYAEGTLIGDSSKLEFTTKIYDNNPTFSDFSFADINTTTTALTGNNTINVNGYSNVQITISASNKAVAKKGASIVSYRVVIGNQTIEIAYSSSASVNGTINGAENGTYNVYAVDSRGNTTLVTKLATAVKEYVPLTRDTNFKAERNNNNVGDRCTLTFSGTIWNSSFGSISNAFDTAKYYLKKTESSIWIDLGSSMTNITPTITNNTFSFSGLIRSDNADTTWDLESSYDIKVVLEDKLSSVEFQTVLASAKPNISISRNGVGINCDYDESLGGSLQVDGNLVPTVLDSYSQSQIDTYSCNYVNNKIAGVVLWTNLSPSSNFNGQTILISNLSSYAYIDIAYFVYKDNKKQCVQRHYYDSTYKDGELMSVFTHNSRGYIGVRQFVVNADNIQFKTNYDFRRSGDANGFDLFGDDGWTIPYKIIGYK